MPPPSSIFPGRKRPVAPGHQAFRGVPSRPGPVLSEKQSAVAGGEGTVRPDQERSAALLDQLAWKVHHFGEMRAGRASTQHQPRAFPNIVHTLSVMLDNMLHNAAHAGEETCPAWAPPEQALKQSRSHKKYKSRRPTANSMPPAFCISRRNAPVLVPP